MYIYKRVLEKEKNNCDIRLKFKKKIKYYRATGLV